MPDSILAATDVRAGYGINEVLHGVDFALPQGEVVGLIGPNGAGKTTLLRTLHGLLELRTGRVEFDGEDISALGPRDRLTRGVAYVPQEQNVFPNLSVIENLELAVSATRSRLRPDRIRERIDFVLDLFPRLAERRSQQAGLMSGGEQRMVAISIGLMARPRVMLLDEPTTGLAPRIVHQLMDAIAHLNRTEGISTVLVEQNIISALRVIHTLYLVKSGYCQRYRGAPSGLSRQKIWEYL